MAEREFRRSWLKLKNGRSHELDCGPNRRFMVTSAPLSDDVRIHSGDLTGSVNQVLHEGETVGIARRVTLSCYRTAQLRVIENEKYGRAA
jgi:hypothetical protein